MKLYTQELLSVVKLEKVFQELKCKVWWPRPDTTFGISRGMCLT